MRIVSHIPFLFTTFAGLFSTMACADKPRAAQPTTLPSPAYRAFLAPLRDEIAHDQSPRFSSSDNQRIARVATTLFRDDSGVFEDVTTIRIHNRRADKNRDVRLPATGNHVHHIAFVNSIAWIHYSRDAANGQTLHRFIDESETATLELALAASRTISFDPARRQIIHFDPQKPSDRTTIDWPPAK